VLPTLAVSRALAVIVIVFSALPEDSPRPFADQVGIDVVARWFKPCGCLRPGYGCQGVQALENIKLFASFGSDWL